MGFLTRCKRLFSFAFLLQNRNTFFSFFLKSFLILSEKQQEVSEYFRVSFTAAQKRIHSLTKKCMWFSGEEEIRLLERYRPFEYAALRLSFAKSV